MSKAKNIIAYYVLCNKLKEVIRTGWKNWNVTADRLESVAEHVYGTQMLAIAIAYEHKDFYAHLDLNKVLLMLAIHELGETVIGDITPFDMPKEEKTKIEHEAIHEILKGLIDGNKLEELLLEFDERKTPEAFFAFQCDKLECDLQCKLYDEKGCVDLDTQENNKSLDDELVQKFLAEGCTWSEMWLKFSQEKNQYVLHFKEISDYALTHKITE